MTEDSIRKTKLGCGVCMVLLFGSVWTYFHFAQRRVIEAAMGGRPERTRAVENPRIQELRATEARNPEAALKLADAMLAERKSEGERRAALSRLPALLQNAALRRLRAGQRAEALALRERLEKTFPASPQAGALRTEWRRALATAAVESLKGGDPAAIEAAYAELWAAGPDDASRFAFEHWSKAKLEPWRETAGRRAGATAIKHPASEYVALARVLPDARMAERIAQEFSRDSSSAGELAELGDAQARLEDRHAALPLWQAARLKLDDDATARAAGKQLDPNRREALRLELRRKLAAGWMDLGDRLRRGERPVFVMVGTSDAFEAAAAAARELTEEMVALTRLLEFEAEEIARLAGPVTQVPFVQLNGSGALAPDIANTISSRAYQVRARVQTLVQRHGLRLWQCCVETSGFDPWPDVPVAVREAVDAPTGAGRAAAAVPEMERRRKLVAHYRTDALHIPLGDLEPLRATMHQVLARWGLVNLSGPAEEALGMLREVLREAADAGLREELAQTLRFRISRTRQTGDFNQFYILAGFYAGEIGLPAVGDPFREEFRQGLEAAAQTFKKGERMKRIFILSLLAQCFPNEPIGQQARTDAFAAAFEAVANMAAAKEGAAVMPSPLAGHSLELMNNSTQHHLLSFYRGREMIAVHCWPWRRGTVVLPDGDYDVVVLSPAAEIRPYRGRATFQRGVWKSDYVIQSSGGRRDNSAGAYRPAATGDYRLLHAPATLGAIAIEPRTGLPRRVSGLGKPDL